MGLKQAAGFTLIEVMVALFIFSIIALTAAFTLHMSVNSEEQTKAINTRLNQLNLTLGFLSDDLAQVIDRPTTDQNGQANLTFTGEETSINFTRGGMTPGPDERESHLEHISYQLTGDTLTRTTWPALDPTDKTNPHTEALLSDIKKIQFTFYTPDLKPNTFWPLPNQIQPTFPKAVVLTITLTNGGEISQTYPIHAYRLEATS